ncbi:MAG: TonB-dependent receptor [Massilia sp.]
MKFKMKSMPLAIATVIASGALSVIPVTQAVAQEAMGAAPEMQKVLVTGSLISRANKETPSPVQVLTADDMAKSGFTTVAEVLSNLTSSGQGNLAQGFSGAFASGASGVSLRGLTLGATLVLIDGHRMAPYPLSDDGQRAFVDVSSIPFDAVERIEVVKDGASSVYGSDAIAGVVNIILKKTYNGTKISAEGGYAQGGGGKNAHVTITHGFGDLQRDGYNLYGSAEFRHANAIKLSDRIGEEWANANFTSRGGIDARRGVPNLQNGLRVAANTPFFYNPALAATNPAAFAFVDSSCDYTRYIAGNCAIPDTAANIQPETENYNFIIGFTKLLGDGWKLNTKASLFDSKDANNRGLPLSYPAGSFAGNTSLVPGQFPKIVNAIPSFLVPANYPGNTLGVPARIYGIIPEIAPTVSSVTQSKSYRLVADLTGSWAGWDINASAGYTKVVTDKKYDGYIDRIALYNALIRPVNPFKVTGGNTAADLAAIAPTFYNQSTDELDFAELRGSRELMPLPGGSLALAAGVSYLHKDLNAPSPALLRDGVVGNGAAYAFGTENITAAFLELNAPLLKTLEANVSARFDHYSTYGNSTTPKAGFKWSPTPAITLRGTHSRGFRAPNAAENAVGSASFAAGAINDPILCADGKATTAGNVVSACSFQVSYIQLTNKDLKPEKSKSTTFGLILEPVKGWATTIDYYNVQINGQINSEFSFPSFVPTYVRSQPLPVTISDGGSATHIGTPALGAIAYIPTNYVNASSTKTTGMEFETSYRFKLGDYGTLKPRFQMTHMFSYVLDSDGVTTQLAGTHGPSGVGGNTGNPKNRAQFSLGYDNGPLNLTTTVNWVGPFSLLDPSTGYDTCYLATKSEASRTNFFNTTAAAPPPVEFCHVPSFTSTDMTLTYKLTPAVTLHATVLNVFDRAAPIDVGTYGNATAQVAYNPAFHQSGAVGRFFNFGAAFQF